MRRLAMRRSQGFTLIEVLVAFAIFALTIGALFELFGGAARRSGAASDAQSEWLLAQTVLSEMRARPTPWMHELNGRTDNKEWRVTTEPYDAGIAPRSRWQAYQVTVRVSREGRQPVELRSIELAWNAP